MQETSLKAYESIQDVVSNLKSRVLAFVRETNGATVDEAEVKLGLLHQTVSARMRELYQAGLVTDKGRRRMTRSGRNAIVWELV